MSYTKNKIAQQKIILFDRYLSNPSRISKKAIESDEDYKKLKDLEESLRVGIFLNGGKDE